MTCGAATATATTGCPRVSTSSRPASPLPQVLCAGNALLSCTTTRSVPRGWVPKRTPVTTPDAAGARTPVARRVLGRSMTTRSG